MEADLLTTLSPREREELALCGVRTTEQLSRSTARRVCADLEQAKSFFPDKVFTLTPERIQFLFSQIGTESAVSDEQVELDFPKVQRMLPAAAPRHRHQSSPRRGAKCTQADRQHILHSPVRCTHPLTAVLAAFCTIGLLIPMAGVFYLLYLLITNTTLTPNDLTTWGIILSIPIVIYLIMARKATCPVCHMRVFRFSHYTRNKAAHYAPLLGYNMSTALHILFCWSYNCPGCGTPIKLLGAKGHRTHC